MSNNCNDLKNLNKDQQMIDFFKGVAAEHGIEDKYNAEIDKQDWYKKLSQSLHDKYLKTGGVVTQKELEKAIKKHVTNNDERTKARLIINLMSLLKNNTILREHFWKDLRYEVVERIPLKGMEESMFTVDEKVIIDEDGDEVRVKVPRLSDLPTPVLNWMYSYAYSWATAGKEKSSDGKINLAPGMLGNLQLELFTPRTIERRESTGAIRMAREATEGYADRSAQFHEEFWQDQRSRDGKTVYRGFSSIMNNVQNMSGEVGVDQDTMLRMYNGFAKKAGERRVTIYHKTGEVWEYQKWVQTGTHEDGNPKYEYEDLQPMIYGGKQVVLSKITPPEARLSNYDEFMDLMKDTQTLFQRIYEAAELRMNRQNKKYNKIQALLNSRKVKHPITGQIMEKGEPIIHEKYEELLTPFFHTLEEGLNVGGFNMLTKVITSEDGVHGYMPQLYISEKLPGMFLKAEGQIKAKIDDLTVELGAGDLSKAERKGLKTQVIQLMKSLKEIKTITSQLGDIQDDPDNETMILSRQQMKNFKAISHIFNPNDARIDKYVIDDYLDSIGKTLERNDTTLKVLDALIAADSEGVSDYVAELYKTTFNYPDVKSTFFTIPTDMITVTQQLKKLNIRVPTRVLMRVFRSIGAYQIYNLLHGGMTGLRNATAVVNKIHDVGLAKVIDAIQEYNGANGADWKRRAQKSGVVNFSRYIEGWINKRLRPDEKRAAKEAIRELKVYLKKDNLSKKDYKRYKRYLTSLRLSHHIESKMDTAAQWAVTHNVQDIDLKSKVGIAKAMYQIPLSMYRIVPSIQGTEGFVRTLSYIIGVKSAVKNGFALNYDDPAANEFGIEYTYRSDHGLSQQHLGFAFRGSLGNLNTKLKYWSTQRTGREFRIFMDALRSAGDYSLDDKGKPIGRKVGLKNIYNMTKATFGFSKGLREANPYLAAWRSFFLLQGTATYLVDFWLLAPGGAYAGTFFRKMMYRNTTLKAGTGLTSDMLSMSFGTINLLWAGLAGLPTPFGDEDDEIDPEEYLMRMARHTHLGVAPMQLLNGLMWLIHRDNKARSRRKGSWDTNYGENAITPSIPLGNTGSGLVKDGFGKSLTELFSG